MIWPGAGAARLGVGGVPTISTIYLKEQSYNSNQGPQAHSRRSLSNKIIVEALHPIINRVTTQID